jgi:hypothetical protein
VPLCGIVPPHVLDITESAEEFLPGHGTDGADLIVVPELVCAVEDRVDVQRGGGRLVGEFAQALDEALLKGVRQVGLCAEEDNAAFGDWSRQLGWSQTR